MKLTGAMRGAAMPPDFEMLRAALIAAQAATATARTAGLVAPAETLAALHDLLTTAETAAADATKLGNSFSRNPPKPGDEA